MMMTAAIAGAPMFPAGETRGTAGAAPGPTAEDLALRARAHGIDAATTWYCQHLRDRHRAFIEAVDGRLPRAARRLERIFLVPGALYREQPRFGSDGRLVRAAAARLGIECRLIPVASLGSVTANAACVAEALAGAEERSVVLVSLSKGGSDTRIALERHPALVGRIRAWINVCGLIRGTPISDSLLGTRWWQRGLLRGYLACTRAHPEFVRELSSAPGTLLGNAPDLPKGLPVISVVGMPLTSHLAPNARVRHGRMAHLGPNDGSTLLHHAIVHTPSTGTADAVQARGEWGGGGGAVYPVWGADHFMRTPEVPDLLQRLLLHVERSS